MNGLSNRSHYFHGDENHPRWPDRRYEVIRVVFLEGSATPELALHGAGSEVAAVVLPLWRVESVGKIRERQRNAMASRFKRI